MTKKKIIISAVILILSAVIGVIAWRCRFYFIGTSSAPVQAKENKDFGIADFHSTVDKDGDGIDDQTDILQGALQYVSGRPKYKSRYYETGYPDDGYGVCTDVVAQAMKGAGYDLMELVAADIAAHPEDYEVPEPDSRIDFRRVRNLQVYFARTAASLTTDPFAVEEWQGGDIVLFKSHMGIVSDRRNERGVPYVIHHNDPWQKAYEEDILEDRDDITGHYRVGEAGG